MVRPRRQDGFFSMDDYVAHQVARILRESREDALRAAASGAPAFPPAVPFVGEATCAAINDIKAHPCPPVPKARQDDSIVRAQGKAELAEASTRAEVMGRFGCHGTTAKKQSL